MIVNYFTFVDNLKVTRHACVVDGQPFYRSSGTSSGLEGAWLPFKKFDEKIPYVTGIIHKPDIAYMEEKDIRKYFPPKVANALQLWHDEDSTRNNWGRFGDMKCLLISCMLSNEDAIPPLIRTAVIDYVGQDNYKNSYLWARPTIFDCGYMLKTRELDNETIEECNDKLRQLGGVIPEGGPFDAVNHVNVNQPQSDESHYPEVLEPEGLLQQFINKIPSLITRAMRFLRRCICSGGQPASQADNAAENPLKNNPLGPSNH